MQGILTENLDKEEERKILKWSEQRTQSKSKIWDIFWGNIISDNHIKTIEENGIDLKELGWHVDKLDEQTVWFTSTKTIDTFDNKKDKFRTKLYDMLEKASLTM